MEMDEDTAYDLESQPLDRLIRVLSEKLPVARVGVLATGRTDDSNNAEVGAAHEFGTSTVPQRSFLRMPIMEKFDGELEKSGAFNEDMLKEVVKSGTIRTWMQKIAKIGERIVLDALATGGFGKWKPWKPGYSNQTGQILVDTQQLKNAITSDVK